MHTIDAADTAVVLVLTDQDILRLERILLAGLEHAARRNGATPAGDRALVERLQLVARQARGRLNARSQASRATGLPREHTADASSATTWLTTTEAARKYGVDASYLRRMASQGALEARLGASGWLLDPDALAGWAAGRTTRVRTERAAA